MVIEFILYLKKYLGEIDFIFIFRGCYKLSLYNEIIFLFCSDWLVDGYMIRFELMGVVFENLVGVVVGRGMFFYCWDFLVLKIIWIYSCWRLFLLVYGEIMFESEIYLEKKE